MRSQRPQTRPPRPEPGPLPLAPGLTDAVAKFFPEAGSVESVGGRSYLVRVETDSGLWCVRRWPAGTHRARIDFVHALLRESRAAGFEFVSNVADLPGERDSTLLLGDGLFDAQSWLPGRPPLRGAQVWGPDGRVVDRPAPLAAQTLAPAVEAIARWHEATRGLARTPTVPAAPLDALLRAVRRAWDDHRERLRPLATRTPHLQRWIRTAEAVFDAAAPLLANADFLSDRPPVIGHFNLWPAHLLLGRGGGGERVTGLVDFANAAAGSPLVDLAQLVGHFGGWNGAAAEEALGAYASAGSLAPEERRLLPAVAALDLVAETGRLLVLGYATPAVAETAGGDAVRSAAADLLLSLEAVLPAVQRGDRKEPSGARKWEHRPSRPVRRASDSPRRKPPSAPRAPRNTRQDR
jgi:Ser/Thr protein kinase RdoA (MazF antagonist)